MRLDVWRFFGNIPCDAVSPHTKHIATDCHCIHVCIHMLYITYIAIYYSPSTLTYTQTHVCIRRFVEQWWCWWIYRSYSLLLLLLLPPAKYTIPFSYYFYAMLPFLPATTTSAAVRCPVSFCVCLGSIVDEQQRNRKIVSIHWRETIEKEWYHRNRIYVQMSLPVVVVSVSA